MCILKLFSGVIFMTTSVLCAKYMTVDVDYNQPESGLMDFNMSGPLLCAKMCQVRPQCISTHYNFDKLFCVLHFSEESLNILFDRLLKTESTVPKMCKEIKESPSPDFLSVCQTLLTNETTLLDICEQSANSMTNITNLCDQYLNGTGMETCNLLLTNNSGFHLMCNSMLHNGSTVTTYLEKIKGNNSTTSLLEKYGYTYELRANMTQSTAAGKCQSMSTSSCAYKSLCMQQKNDHIHCFDLACNANPPPVENMHVTSRGVDVGTYAHYSCDTRYLPYDKTTQKVICKEKFFWSTPTFSCVYTCLKPQKYHHDLQLWIQDGGVRVGDRRRMYCYSLTYFTGGSIYITCQPDGTWSNITLQCTGCRHPPGMNYAVINKGDYRVGTTRTYNCKDGYAPANSSLVPSTTCLVTNKWSSFSTVCEIFGCGPPPQITYGNVKSGNTDFGDIRKYTCKAGYPSQAPEGIPYVVCNATTEKWEPVVSPCRGCGPAPSSRYANIDPGSTDHNDVRTFTCWFSFISNGANGKPHTKCQTNSRWTGVYHQCYDICHGYAKKLADRWCLKFKRSLNWNDSVANCPRDRSGKILLLDSEMKIPHLLYHMRAGTYYYIGATPTVNSSLVTYVKDLPTTTTTELPTTTAVAMETTTDYIETTTRNSSNDSSSTMEYYTFTERINNTTSTMESTLDGNTTMTTTDPNNTTPTDAITTPMDAIMTPTDAINTPTDAITTPTDAITTPTDAMTTPTDAITTQTDALTTQTDAITTPTDAITTPTDAITTPTDSITTPTDSVNTTPTDVITTSTPNDVNMTGTTNVNLTTQTDGNMTTPTPNEVNMTGTTNVYLTTQTDGNMTTPTNFNMTTPAGVNITTDNATINSFTTESMLTTTEEIQTTEAPPLCPVIYRGHTGILYDYMDCRVLRYFMCEKFF